MHTIAETITWAVVILSLATLFLRKYNTAKVVAFGLCFLGSVFGATFYYLAGDRGNSIWWLIIAMVWLFNLITSAIFANQDEKLTQRR